MEVLNRGAQLFDDSQPRDYNHATDSNYKHLRAEADKLYKKRNQLSQQSQAAYKSGDGKKAHDLSEKAKQVLDEAENYNRQAAAYVFRENNTDSAEDEIDLHGLYVKEAEYFLQVRIVHFVRTHQSHLKVIVGKGLHSKNGIAKLKPAIDEMCDESGLRHRIDSHNLGVLIIDLQGKSVDSLPRRWVNLPPLSNGGYQSQPAPHYGQQHGHSPQHGQSPHHNNNNSQLVNLFVKVLCMCLNR